MNFEERYHRLLGELMTHVRLKHHHVIRNRVKQIKELVMAKHCVTMEMALELCKSDLIRVGVEEEDFNYRNYKL